MNLLCIFLTFVIVCSLAVEASVLPSINRWALPFRPEKLSGRACSLAKNATSVGIDTFHAAGLSFVQACPMSVPFAMVMNVGKHPNMKTWMSASVKDGIDLARVSAAYKVFCLICLITSDFFTGRGNVYTSNS